MNDKDSRSSQKLRRNKSSFSNRLFAGLFALSVAIIIPALIDNHHYQKKKNHERYIRDPQTIERYARALSKKGFTQDIRTRSFPANANGDNFDFHYSLVSIMDDEDISDYYKNALNRSSQPKGIGKDIFVPFDFQGPTMKSDCDIPSRAWRYDLEIMTQFINRLPRLGDSLDYQTGRERLTYQKILQFCVRHYLFRRCL